MSDEELISRIRQGDETAAEELIHRYYPSVFRYCRYRCGNRETAEDLTQETFLRLFRYISSYRNEGRFRAYLFSIASRLCSSESKSALLYSLEDEERLEDPRDGLRQVEDRDELRSLLEALPPKQREAVLLRFGERLRFLDIAKAAGCTIWTAQGRVRCALRNMRKEIGHEK